MNEMKFGKKFLSCKLYLFIIPPFNDSRKLEPCKLNIWMKATFFGK